MKWTRPDLETPVPLLATALLGLACLVFGIAFGAWVLGGFTPQTKLEMVQAVSAPLSAFVALIVGISVIIHERQLRDASAERDQMRVRTELAPRVFTMLSQITWQINDAYWTCESTGRVADDTDGDLQDAARDRAVRDEIADEQALNWNSQDMMEIARRISEIDTTPADRTIESSWAFESGLAYEIEEAASLAIVIGRIRRLDERFNAPVGQRGRFVHSNHLQVVWLTSALIDKWGMALRAMQKLVDVEAVSPSKQDNVDFFKSEYDYAVEEWADADWREIR